MKKTIKKLKQRRHEKKLQLEDSSVPRITNENVAEHREEILSGARKYIYPLQHSKHQIVWITVSVVVVTVMIFIFSVVFLLYRQQSTSNFMYQISKVVPLPIARNGGMFIAYENYLFELRHYIHYYETQQKLNFESEEGKDQLNSYKKRALENVINQAYLEKIAKENGVSVSEQEIDEQIRIEKEQNRLGSTDAIFEDVLREYWDWTVADFRRSLSNKLLTQKVTRALDPETEKRASEVLAMLKAGEDFSDVAKKYSDDEDTKNNGGNFGFVDASNRNVTQATVDTLMGLKVGEISSIVAVPYRGGYALAIVKNNEIKGSQYNGSHILFKLKDINETLNDRKEKEPYRVYISIPE